MNSASIGECDLYFDTNKSELISPNWYSHSRPELENLTIFLVFILTSPLLVALAAEFYWIMSSFPHLGTCPVSLCHQDGRRQAVDSEKPQLDPGPSWPQVVDGQPGRDLPTTFYSSGLSC